MSEEARSDQKKQDNSTSEQQATDVRAVLKSKIASTFREKLEEAGLPESNVLSLLAAIDGEVPTAKRIIESLKDEEAVQ